MMQNFHYDYISKKDIGVKAAYAELTRLLCEVQDLLRDKFTFQFRRAGSYGRNMITYDKRTNVGYDLDFDLELQRGYKRFSPKELRDFFRNAISEAACKAGYDFAEDSSRVLTIKKKDRKHARIRYSADFVIVCNDEDGGQRIIRFDKRTGRYIWNEQTEKNEELASRQRWIKEKELWNDLCDLYLDKKNDCRNEGIHSRQLFSMAANEICQRNGYFSEEPYQQVKFGPMMIRLW